MLRILIYIYIIVLCVELVNPEKNRSKKASAADSCFCKLHGEVDDCSCKVESLDSLNNKKVYPRLQSILSKDYFKYFKVDLKKECPFWSDDSRCAIKDCHVDACKEEEVPFGIKETVENAQSQNKYSKEAQQEHSCDQERELSALDTTISEESKEAFKDWTKYDDAQETFCELDDDNSSSCEYVNLLLNPERYTGYAGASPNRIWNSIYEENCFKPHSEYTYGSQQSISGTFEGMCLEKRAFYRLISGLHTSINIHLSAKYLLPAKNGYGTGTWGHNVQEFLSRFSSEQTNEEGPQRLKNLYFTYLVVLRAVAKAAPYLEEENFYTGNSDEDMDVKNGVLDFLSVVKSFPDHFDESKLFQGNQKEAKILKEEFRNHFRNISRIMDCVGCDKCRLWGKLQVQGLGTALKILFSGDGIGPGSTVNANEKKKFQLRRTEIVSLINGFGRLSSSIREIEEFRQMIS